MKEFPHLYRVIAVGGPEGEVSLESRGLTSLATAPPAEFGGPGDRWSPESLLTGAVADCFIFTFRAVSRASRVPWIALTCAVEGRLDRIDRATQFTAFNLTVHLQVPDGVDVEAARRALMRAEQVCLITNSLKATVHLDARVESADFAISSS